MGQVIGGRDNMTIENCKNGCLAAGYAFAGLEYASECWCDSQLRNGGGPAPDGEARCTMPCTGNSQQICGGPDRLNLYQNTAVPGPTNVATVTSSPGDPTAVPSSTTTREPLPTSWKYAGCYVDNTRGRIMAKQLPDDRSLTIESCVSRCASMGYTVAGTQFASQCFCDNYVRKAAPLAAKDSECAMSCGGDGTQKCGGPDRMSVYSKGDLVVLPVPATQTGGLPGSWKYQGCLE